MLVQNEDMKTLLIFLSLIAQDTSAKPDHVDNTGNDFYLNGFVYPGGHTPELPPGNPVLCSGLIVSGKWRSAQNGNLYLYPDCTAAQNGQIWSYDASIANRTITMHVNGLPDEVCPYKMAPSADMDVLFLALSCPVRGLQLYSNEWHN